MKVFKFIRENIGVVITIITAFFTTVFTIIKLLSYIYWKGYTNYWDIDNTFIKIDYSNMLFEVIFYGCILSSVIYLLWCINDMFKKNRTRFYKKSDKFYIRVFRRFRVEIINVILGFIMMSAVNIPIILLMDTDKSPIQILKMTQILILLYLMEIYCLLVFLLLIRKDKSRFNGDYSKISFVIIAILAFTSFTTTFVYHFGIDGARDNKKFKIIQEQDYAITYRSGDNYVANKAEYDEKTITIYKNIQKIIPIKECEYKIIDFQNVNQKMED